MKRLLWDVCHGENGFQVTSPVAIENEDVREGNTKIKSQMRKTNEKRSRYLNFCLKFLAPCLVSLHCLERLKSFELP